MLCIMDSTNPIFNLDVKKELDLISEIEEITRNLTFDLHNCRAVFKNLEHLTYLRNLLFLVTVAICSVLFCLVGSSL
jgi:hypothetical protein